MFSKLGAPPIWYIFSAHLQTQAPNFPRDLKHSPVYWNWSKSLQKKRCKKGSSLFRGWQLSHFGYIGHHLIVAIIDHIPFMVGWCDPWGHLMTHAVGPYISPNTMRSPFPPPVTETPRPMATPTVNRSEASGSKTSAPKMRGKCGTSTVSLRYNDSLLEIRLIRHGRDGDGDGFFIHIL